MHRTVQTSVPKAPHPDTLADGDLLIIDEANGLLICYCPRNRCGALYALEVELWKMISPISFGDWLQVIEAQGIRLPEGANRQRWFDRIEAVTLLASGGANQAAN